MNSFVIGIIIFILTFVFQILLILKKNLKITDNKEINIKKESKLNVRIFGKIIVAIILSFFLSVIGLYVSAIIFLGKDLSV